jgi:hypothetical protein
MRNAVAAVALAVAVTAVVTIVATLGLTGYFQPVARPSPSPTPTATSSPSPTASASPTPTLSPTPTPTIAPTAPPQQTRTPRPDPTTNIAGQQLIPYYFQARQQFPIFPPTPQIDFDMASDRDGDAFFRGLTPVGQPIFTVREDFVMTQRTAFHEIGHAYEALLQRKDASVDWRARYWAFRGFPGTWQAAAAEAATKSGMAQWIVQPQESWAEAFSIAFIGSGQEKTLDYGRTINPAAMKAFFQSLTNP